jgi:orotidine-5'-phosphate decarboxylase
MVQLSPSERLIVAADFKPLAGLPAVHARQEIYDKILALADLLRDTGIYLKVNSALRLCGYELMQDIHERGLKVFADLKLSDIPETLGTDGMALALYRPELVTVMCSTGVSAMEALQAELLETEVLGVTVLTSFSERECIETNVFSIQPAIMHFSSLACEAGIGGLISGPKEVKLLREKYGHRFSYNCPGIRPLWSLVPGDDQNPDRVMTPSKAIFNGADRIVVGRPITGATNPKDAVMRILEEIATASALVAA